MNIPRPQIWRMILLTLFGACAFMLPAQNIDIQDENNVPLEEKLVYRHQNSVNVAIHSQGFGFGFKIGKIKSIHKTVNWEAEVISLRSLKEIKTINVSEYFTRPYVYGKLNNVFVARFGYGQENRIFGKPYWGGIETWWTYEIGASLALMKPYYYYVSVYKPSGETGFVEVVEEQTFDNHTQWLNIIGRSAFTKGLAETKLSPGAHASVGLSFEIGKQRTRLQALNMKLVAEGFPMGVPIMDGQRINWFYLTLHLSYNWGSRFNKY